MSDRYVLVDYVESHCPPENGLKLGYQNDGAGDLWVAVAKTQWGTIPGKAKGGTCWYSYSGEEHEVTSDFAYVTTKYTKAGLEANQSGNQSGSPPQFALLCGYQYGAGYLYAAIADTDWGKIPGKAKAHSCWYAYGGKEYKTSDFSWVTLSSD